MVRTSTSGAALRAANDTGLPEAPDTLAIYRETISLVERLHRQLLDVVSDELTRAGQADLTAVQAMLLYNIGEGEFSAGELRARGLYQGSNVSYNLKKLVDLGLLRHQKSQTDKRMVRVSLTDKGVALSRRLADLFQRHARTLAPVGGVETGALALANATGARLERFWGDQIRFRL